MCWPCRARGAVHKVLAQVLEAARPSNCANDGGLEICHDVLAHLAGQYIDSLRRALNENGCFHSHPHISWLGEIRHDRSQLHEFGTACDGRLGLFDFVGFRGGRSRSAAKLAEDVKAEARAPAAASRVTMTSPTIPPPRTSPSPLLAFRSLRHFARRVRTVSRDRRAAGPSPAVELP